MSKTICLKPSPLLYCSICEKSQDEVRYLLSGSTVNICSACVALCNKLIDEKMRDEIPDMPPANRTESQNVGMMSNNHAASSKPLRVALETSSRRITPAAACSTITRPDWPSAVLSGVSVISPPLAGSDRGNPPAAPPWSRRHVQGPRWPPGAGQSSMTGVWR